MESGFGREGCLAAGRGEASREWAGTSLRRTTLHMQLYRAPVAPRASNNGPAKPTDRIPFTLETFLSVT